MSPEARVSKRKETLFWDFSFRARGELTIRLNLHRLPLRNNSRLEDMFGENLSRLAEEWDRNPRPKRIRHRTKGSDTPSLTVQSLHC